MTRRFWLMLACILCAFAARAAAETVTLECAADTQICAHAERSINAGRKTQIRVKGTEAYALLRFDMSKLKGRKASGAKLFITSAGGGQLVIDRVSTVTVEWKEGAAGWEKNHKGGANFDYAVYRALIEHDP